MKKLLLGSAVAVALLTGCGEEKKESTQATETKQEIKKDETTTQAVAEKTSEQVKENSQKIEEPKETTTTVKEFPIMGYKNSKSKEVVW